MEQNKNNVNSIYKNVLRGIFITYVFIYISFLLLSLFNVKLSRSEPIYPIFDKYGDALRFTPISLRFPFGTDYFGFDLFSQVYAGLKTNFIFSLITAVTFIFFGILFGVRIGYYYRSRAGDFKRFINSQNINQTHCKQVTYYPDIWLKKLKVDTFIKIVVNIFDSFPLLLLVLMMTIFLDGWIRSTNIKLALLMGFYGLFSAPRLAKMIIGKIKGLRAEDFILSAISLGLSNRKIIWKHILWYECRYLILYQFAYMLGQASILEVTLTFFNFGAQFPWISWGFILNNVYKAPLHFYIVFPIFFITMTINMYMKTAEVLKDIAEIRSK